VTFLLAPENMVFGIAIALMLGIGLLEGLMAILGGGLSHLLDSLLPESLTPTVEVDLEHGIGSDSALSSLLGWICLGKVPVLVLLVAWLCLFGLVGYGVQAATQTATGLLIPGAFAWLPALVLSLPLVRYTALGLAKIIPQDQTDAVSIDSLVGEIAVIVTGTAKKGQPAQARLKDKFGTTHYVMVEPDLEDESFPSGTQVLLVSRTGPWFRAILIPNPQLIDPIT
jgi:hypothetical protein